MIPLGDENDDGLGGPAVVNLAIIALNVLVFIYQSLHPSFTDGFSMIPREITTGHDLVTTQYVMGSDGARYAVPEASGPSPIYLTLFTALFMHASVLHIAGNMLFLYIFGDNIERAFGSVRYLLFYVLFPGNRVRVLAGYWLTTVPAAIMIGLWIVVQFLSLGGQQDSGVAYGAHVSGFLFGLLVAFIVRPSVMRRMPYHYSRDG